jgi:uncharacterized membrane protein
MTPKQLALLVGGVLPAFLLGFAGIFQKLAMNGSMGTGPFLIVTGATTMIVGGIFTLCENDGTHAPRAVGYTVLFALMWGSASGLISLALRKLGGQMSQLVPLYNMNTLIAVLAGLMMLSEWRTVSPPRILLAAAMIIVGGILAARS